MGKLLERLSDASRSGVYRARRVDEILDALQGSGIALVRVEAAEKTALIAAIARGLAFPGWFGGNWDALEDCLCDLSWRPADGYVLLFEREPEGEDRTILLEVLQTAASCWREMGKPFFAVLIDPQRSLGLPELFREA